MKKIKCVIIDDEALAIEVLKDYISKIPFLELSGSFDSPMKSLDFVNHHPVDLLFLDINMPDLDGMTFYENLTRKPQVIFTTAYSNYALQGFEMNATDYLLKPISFERFFKAINKVHQPKTSLSTHNQVPQSPSKFIFIKSEHKAIKIDLNEIIYIEGYKDYVKIHLRNDPNPILTLNSIKRFESDLFAYAFIRIHKRFIISIDKIESISRNKVKLKYKEPYIPIGESYKDFFYETVVNKKL